MESTVNASTDDDNTASQFVPHPTAGAVGPQAAHMALMGRLLGWARRRPMSPITSHQVSRWSTTFGSVHEHLAATSVEGQQAVATW